MGERKSLHDRLRENNLSFVWLIAVLNRVGVHTDKSEMSSAVRGTISGEKATVIIEKSHAVLDQYESFIRSVAV
jgi:hypothetical protein